jgi:hypothetical protein
MAISIFQNFEADENQTLCSGGIPSFTSLGDKVFSAKLLTIGLYSDYTINFRSSGKSIEIFFRIRKLNDHYLIFIKYRNLLFQDPLSYPYTISVCHSQLRHLDLQTIVKHIEVCNWFHEYNFQMVVQEEEPGAEYEYVP